jgi:hypothetical protein
LSSRGSSALLIDVGKPNEFNARHLAGAVNWPFEDIRNLKTGEMPPEEFRSKVAFLSAVLIIPLLKRNSSALVSLKWALVCFLVGEAFCALNCMVFQHESHLSEFLHGYGMVLCFAFASYAMIEGIDQRLLNYTDPKRKCIALGLCKNCIKYTDAPCGFQRMLYFLIASAIILGFMPFGGELRATSYNSMIHGVFYNYSHPVIYQIFETRYCPIYAIVMFVAVFLVLLAQKGDADRIFKLTVAAGLGSLGFAFFRFVLVQAFYENLVWFDFWEELTELLFVLDVGLVLWVFRHDLFRNEAGEQSR